MPILQSGYQAFWKICNLGIQRTACGLANCRLFFAVAIIMLLNLPKQPNVRRFKQDLAALNLSRISESAYLKIEMYRQQHAAFRGMRRNNPLHTVYRCITSE